MSADPASSAAEIPDSGPVIRKRRSLPRVVRVALSLSRGTIAFLLFGFVVLLAGAFFAGMLVGLRVHDDPMIVEKIVEKEVPTPVAAALAAPSAEKKDQPVSSPPPATPKPKLNVIIGPPDDASTWGVQIGAFPDLATAQLNLDAHVAGLAAYPIYIVPAEIKGKGVWHRVRLGSFKSRAEAEKARAALADDLAKQAMVVSYK